MNNETLWWHTLTFLESFKSLKYANISLNVVLLRDFQKYLFKNINLIKNRRRFSKKIHSSCLPYLIDSKPFSIENGYTLIRANLYPLTEGVKDEKIIYLAHRKSEYLEVKKQLPKENVIYIEDIAEAKQLIGEEKTLLNNLDSLLASSDLPIIFKTKSFNLWLRKKIAKTLPLIRRIHRLFETYSIVKTIYGSTINYHGALITSVAKTRKIPTFNLQHGILGEIGHLPVNADINLVWSQADKNFLLDNGVSKERIKVIGPYFFQSIRKEFPKTILQNTEKHHEKIKVLVALQPLGTIYNKKMITMIEKAKEAFPRKLVIYYKLHPEQKNIDLYRNFLKSRLSFIIPHGEVSLHELIKGVDFIITPFSTVAYEALMLNRPVVFFGSKKKLYLLKGEPTCVNSLSAVKNVFKKAIKDSAYLDLIKKRAGLEAIATKQCITDNLKIWKLINSFPKG